MRRFVSISRLSARRLLFSAAMLAALATLPGMPGGASAATIRPPVLAAAAQPEKSGIVLVQDRGDDRWKNRRFRPQVDRRYKGRNFNRNGVPRYNNRRSYQPYRGNLNNRRYFDNRSRQYPNNGARYGPANRRGAVPLGSIVSRVRARVGGKVLGAQVRGNMYVIRMLRNDGRIVYVYADRTSGRILSVRGGR